MKNLFYILVISNLLLCSQAIANANNNNMTVKFVVQNHTGYPIHWAMRNFTPTINYSRNTFAGHGPSVTSCTDPVGNRNTYGSGVSGNGWDPSNIISITPFGAQFSIAGAPETPLEGTLNAVNEASNPGSVYLYGKTSFYSWCMGGKVFRDRLETDRNLIPGAGFITGPGYHVNGYQLSALIGSRIDLVLSSGMHQVTLTMSNLPGFDHANYTFFGFAGGVNKLQTADGSTNLVICAKNTEPASFNANYSEMATNKVGTGSNDMPVYGILSATPISKPYSQGTVTVGIWPQGTGACTVSESAA